MYWNIDYEQAIEYRNGWIVTLDVLKLRSNGSIEDTKESWIVTLDVLKYKYTWQCLGWGVVE